MPDSKVVYGPPPVSLDKQMEEAERRLEESHKWYDEKQKEEEQQRELDKMAEVREKSQAIGEFLEWLQDEKGYSICMKHDYEEDGVMWSELLPIPTNTEKLLAEHFGIDLNAAEQEKRSILSQLKSAKP